MGKSVLTRKVNSTHHGTYHVDIPWDVVILCEFVDITLCGHDTYIYIQIDMIFHCLLTAILLMATLHGCHQHLTDPSSYLLSPNYPEQMILTNGFECKYTITLPVDRRIALYWEYFNLGHDCNPARIEVGYHGMNGENIAACCEYWVLMPMVWLT